MFIMRGQITPEELLRRCKEVDGNVVLLTGESAYYLDLLKKLPNVAILNHPAPQEYFTSFSADDFDSVRKVVELLYELGHRRLRYMHINDSTPPNLHLIRRHAAFIALTSHPDSGMQDSKAVVLEGRTKPLVEVCKDLLTEWMSEPTPPTAVVAASDNYALAFIQAARDLHIKVPEQLSIAGIDDRDFATTLSPSLTTIRQPLEDVGACAIRWLHATLNGYPSLPCQHLFGVTLKVRESTAPAHRG